jgi:hypothetical protein
MLKAKGTKQVEHTEQKIDWKSVRDLNSTPLDPNNEIDRLIKQERKFLHQPGVLNPAQKKLMLAQID